MYKILVRCHVSCRMFLNCSVSDNGQWMVSAAAAVDPDDESSRKIKFLGSLGNASGDDVQRTC